MTETPGNTTDLAAEVQPSAAPPDPYAHLRHELRTPLNQIIGYSEMLQEDAEASGQNQYVADLQKIQRAARNLLSVISDNLSPSKFTPGPQIRALAPEVSFAASAAPLISSESRASEVVSVEARLVGGRLLVVDDNEMNRDMLSRRLEKQGCVVSTAADGLLALEAVKKQPFDLILLDVMMPELDGYAVLAQLKADQQLRHIPVIMISALDELESVVRCIEAGAEDYLPKPFNPTLLRARIGACLEKKQLRDQEQRTYHALVESQRHLAAELAEAADYVRSLLPPPVAGDISAEWQFIPSTQLGGDAFGYHWLDPEHFAIYLLDVCGHGVGAALLSISAMNVLRSQSLPSTDFRVPAQVLAGLNEAFQMEKQNNMYFTIWYGVYNTIRRKLAFSSGGHPPAMLVPPPSAGLAPRQLRTGGLVIGTMSGVTFKDGECEVPRGSRLFVFSDGTYEVARPDGEMLRLDEFCRQLSQPSAPGRPDLDRIAEFSRSIQGRPNFDDDFSIMKLTF